ncbi:hypothetical protein [Pseudodesulfovibrio portus]|uniref:Uncharacterized protein n=1 Tax=Pseudodesulfovibrio portus TaxID=231439 RepID=A0ABM8AVJ3_9BACT|nr:hypothetical protein [Pseudodesulfovibrio portus]BDQ35479.1 hypothetical protein JCM14722_30210 [Pseudodesulfovibrio portus]
MKKLFATLAVFVLVLSAGVASAATTTITFQETPTWINSTTFTIGDVTFENWIIARDNGNDPNKLLLTVGYQAPASASIIFSSAVDVTQFYLSMWNTTLSNDAGASYTATSMVDGLMTNLVASLPGFLTVADFEGVTKLTFNLSPMYSVVTMDNLTFSPTPIPGAIWLLGSGLVGLVGLRRKFL